MQTPHFTKVFRFINYACCFALLLFCGSKVHAQITFSLNSSNNFVITCSNPTITVFATGNFTAPVTYTLVSAQQTTVSAGSSCSVSVPGVYTLYIGSGNQVYSAPLNIITDTQPPGVAVSALTRTLTCDVSTLQLQASSATPSVSFNWMWLSSPIMGTSSSAAITVSANLAAPNMTIVNNYSVTATNTVNGCTSTSIVTIWQNVKIPNAVISPVSATLTCNTPSVNLSNFSTSGNPPGGPFPPIMPIISYLWLGPQGAPTKSNSSTYLASLPGTYTMFVKDMNNGCTSSQTITIVTNTLPPVFNLSTPFFLNCPGNIVLSASLMTPSTSIVSWKWTVPPTATVSGISAPFLVTSSPGYYTLTVTNNQGCSSSTVIAVYACTGLNEAGLDAITVKVFPNPVHTRLSLEVQGAAEGLEVHIKNTLGQIVYKQPIQHQQQEIDMSAFAKGVYFIRIQNGSGQKTLKVVKD
jgi:hypothetical protein